MFKAQYDTSTMIVDLAWLLQNDPEIGPALREAQSKGPSGAMGLMNNRGLMEKLQVCRVQLLTNSDGRTHLALCSMQACELASD